MEGLLSQEANLQVLVHRYGSLTVWEASEAILGMPPTWLPSVKELVAIQTFLESESNTETVLF